MPAAQRSRIPRKSNGASAGGVYETLRRQIIGLALTPGQSLDERTLVNEHGVSRTPVREALIRLAADGLVELTPNRGASVSSLDLETLRSIFEAGDFIEKAMVRLACLRRTESHLEDVRRHQDQFERDVGAGDIAAMVESNTRFHMAIAAASGNRYLEDCYRRILADHERIGQLWYSHNLHADDGSINATIIEQHHDLLAALEARDAQRAEAVSMAHAALCKDGLRQILAEGEHLLKNIHVEHGTFNLESESS